MSKKSIPTIAAKNRIIANIIAAVDERQEFLLLGHADPDEDCIASMVSFALILSKFSKSVSIFLEKNIHERFNFLLKICRFNAIRIVHELDPADRKPDTMIVCDTPKPDMVAKDEDIENLMKRDDIVTIEIDHHMGADSSYIGDGGYRLVTEASSASELVGHILLKIANNQALLQRYQVIELFSRNLALAILTGIVGESQMGKFLKSRKEKRYYEIFSSFFNQYLTRKTTKASNLSDIDDVFRQLQQFSKSEEHCYALFMSRKRFSSSIGYVYLTDEQTWDSDRECVSETIVSVARFVADTLAEESGKLSLVAYYDDPEVSDLVQFRIRRSYGFKNFDTRDILGYFKIENGGGHEGAIGFRIPRHNIRDIDSYILELVSGIEDLLPA